MCIFIILFIYILNIIKNDFCEKFDTTTTAIILPTPTPTPTQTGLNTKEIKLELNDGYNKMNEHRFKKLDRQEKINKLNTKINKLLIKIYTSYDNNITPDTNTMKFY